MRRVFSLKSGSFSCSNISLRFLFFENLPLLMHIFAISMMWFALRMRAISAWVSSVVMPKRAFTTLIEKVVSRVSETSSDIYFQNAVSDVQLKNKCGSVSIS